MSIQGHTEHSDAILDLIERSLSGKNDDYRSLHDLLMVRLVVVPIMSLDSEWEGDCLYLENPYSGDVVKIPVGMDEKGMVVPLFSSRGVCLSWLNQAGLKADGIPIYAADVAFVLEDSARIVLNPGDNTAIMLERSFLARPGRELLGVEQSLYGEFRVGTKHLVVETPPAEIPKVDETQSQAQDLGTKDSAPKEVPLVIETNTAPNAPMRMIVPESVVAVSVQADPVEPAIETPAPPKTKARIGIDDIDFRTPENRPNTGLNSRTRQGTFTKILDALKSYRS